MKAVGLKRYLPIEHEESFLDVEVSRPTPKGKDLLVKVHAISVNPVDTKQRAPKDKVEEEPRILGWDASGIVEEVGEDCTDYKIGDEVYYAGSITRSGSYSEYQLVDERIVGRKPSSLGFAKAAALPLTAITAWEALFERLGINAEAKSENEQKQLLIIGGAGGVGSIAIQLAKWAGLTVTATASREETSTWVQKMGADSVANHHESLVNQLHGEVDYILCLNNTDQHWDAMAEIIKPQGKICSIVENKEPLDLNVLKSKSATFVWEFMFTRAMYETPDMIQQQKLLDQVSQLIEEGHIQTTLTETLSPIEAKTIKEAHAKVESGKMIGKIVVEGF
ncbi:zinc-binding alcohol dehydrogenase family protein [Alkalicoccobacillus murimartini]|uniref:Zinc-type alcohol dehydrogenase-like protein n=1 Tax=Alkalicoccobacillus murimartini TaxID=171685 RepID=A0ABT9YIF2_9BACI|nr:zinc-binding alcohol dehydrogenase family protein [Alkalicoccobacillus murimartini]MDQ0207270.1 zinc-binding alcohol dehydrogenase family protein [Alkalicoccobacillus murimartini]